MSVERNDGLVRISAYRLHREEPRAYYSAFLNPVLNLRFAGTLTLKPAEASALKTPLRLLTVNSVGSRRFLLRDTSELKLSDRGAAVRSVPRSVLTFARCLSLASVSHFRRRSCSTFLGSRNHINPPGVTANDALEVYEFVLALLADDFVFEPAGKLSQT
jgi:hypothetical protein